MKEKEKIIIGTLELPEYINEERRIGFFPILKKKSATLELFINPKEGPICHFHAEKTDKSFKTCVCIYEPCYFIHKDYIDKFNNEQKERLDYYLRQPSIYNPKETNWERAIRLWKENNPDNYNRYTYEKIIKMKYKDKPKQPDYTTMEKTVQNPS